MSRPSAFKTLQGEATFLAAYDSSMKLWPVPYENLDIPSRFGTTHMSWRCATARALAWVYGDVHDVVTEHP